MRYNNLFVFSLILVAGIFAIAQPAYAANVPITISKGASATNGICSATTCFNPQVANISIGDTITWTNADTVGHTATSGHPSDNQTGTVFDSSLIAAGKSYTSTAFNTAGTYNYFCMVHPWMTGEIIVGTASVSPITPPYTPPLSQTPSGTQVTISRGASATNGTCSATSCFNPNILNINIGQTVTWTNTDTVGHTATSGKPSDSQTGTVFDSSLIAAGKSYTSTAFNTAGTYNYFCMVHPWMTGEIIVGNGVQSSPPTPTPYTINVQSDKSSYNPGDTTTITTYSPGVPAGQNVAILVTDPLSNVISSRTISTDNQGYGVLKIGLPPDAKAGTYQITATMSYNDNYVKGSAQFMVLSPIYTPQLSSVSLTSVQPTDQQGNNSVTSFTRGGTGFAKVVLSSTSSQSALVTLNLVGSDGTSLGIGSIKTTLGSGSSETVVSFYIPAGASVGAATIYADVYSDWPSNGGTPLTAESSATVGIQ
ncbi:MAG: hypothetical protein KGH89_05225 [Thaumarchaeota archaeon]|nr:hypothetical protein [Nitrososphaerota archaeon]